jgi:high-affinity Fe2+/Pb2+ permease
MENREFLKAMLAEMNAKMDATQEKIDANTKAIQERMNEMKDKIKKDMNAKRNAGQEKAYADRQHMQEMMRTNQERMEAKMKEIMETQFGSVATKLDAW